MRVAIGSDHAGFALKELQKKFGFTSEKVVAAAKQQIAKAR